MSRIRGGKLNYFPNPVISGLYLVTFFNALLGPNEERAIRNPFKDFNYLDCEKRLLVSESRLAFILLRKSLFRLFEFAPGMSVTLSFEDLREIPSRASLASLKALP